MTINWSPSADPFSMTNQASGVLGYYVYRDGKRVAFTKLTTYTDNGVSPRTEYSYTVGAADAAANVSALPAAVKVTTPAAAPARPVRH